MTYMAYTLIVRYLLMLLQLIYSVRSVIGQLVVGQLLPQEDKIALAGIYLLFRMRLGGDVIIGRTSFKRPISFLTSETSPHILVYDTDELKPISSLGTFPAPRKPAVSTLPLLTYAIDTPPFTGAYFSTAPLEHVEKLKIFNDAGTGYCMGILLKYKNGAQRSLGQCRIGVDQVDYHDNPVRLCLQRCQVPSKAVRNITSLQVTNVKILCTTEHHHIEDGWTCYTLQGQLHFWYACNETHLTIVFD
ncbi:hypothetical protein C2857_000510 [Epichloe festucae Fl1]|uniref:Uncharacterized protein n=1 Tax=Epichloe festucae (strain Fl1) TaxID=877507 RepID=A0A7S9KRC1_EPIFF|nr:hypothetical protein C2857_000510 [Epichloe festucae Fl1]